MRDLLQSNTEHVGQNAASSVFGNTYKVDHGTKKAYSYNYLDDHYSYHMMRDFYGTIVGKTRVGDADWPAEAWVN